MQLYTNAEIDLLLGAEWKRIPKEPGEIQVFRFRQGNRNKQSAFQARFMRNETILLGSFPGFSFTLVYPRNNP
jgi:hypothetical protein